ncbi:Uncharacterized protein Fot_25158 [Forsythia ovata]|uniref:Uncharacterized protein n=1 Tax=Forsythia ovata TaxID=205694 RepID=A0ABD1U890_9LAMI
MERVEKWVEHVRGLFGGHEDPESDPIYWACNKYPSELNISDFTKLRDQDRVPNGVRMIFLNKKDRPCSPLEGQVAITSDALTYGMRLPIHPFFRAILKSYNQEARGRQGERKKAESEKEKRSTASTLFGPGKLPIQSLEDKEDLEILDEDALKMVKKLRTVSSRFSSYQKWKSGMLPEASTSPTPQEKSKPLAYPEIWHIKKVLEDNQWISPRLYLICFRTPPLKQLLRSIYIGPRDRSPILTTALSALNSQQQRL